MLDLAKALALLSLPRTLGAHPETGETIIAGLGRFGPYLRSGDTYISLRGDDDVLSIGLNRAVDLLSRARPGKTKGKDLGAHPADGQPVLLKAGRYGAYVEHGGVRATLPAGTDAEKLDLERATALLAEKAAESNAARQVEVLQTGRRNRKEASHPPAPRSTGEETRGQVLHAILVATSWISGFRAGVKSMTTKDQLTRAADTPVRSFHGN